MDSERGDVSMSKIECKNLSKSYGNKTALNNVNLSLEGGHIIGLLGPNGSGKTTLIKLMVGLLQPSLGEILIDNEAPSPSTKAKISYLSDASGLPEYMSVQQLLNFYKDFYQDFDEQRAKKMLDSLSIDPKSRYKTLSKGTREKVQLILTMSRRAKFYILDEPIAGVDPAARDYILKTILANFDEDATLVISTHLIADVEAVLDQAIFLKEGEVVLFDTVDAIREEKKKSLNEFFKEVYAC